MHVLRVALPLPLEAMSYLPPHGAETEEAVGRRVVVPWRNELRVGLVIGAEEEAGHTFHLRSAVAYLDKSSWVTPAGVEFLLAATAEVFAPVGILLSDLIPFLEPELVHRVRLLPGAQKSVVPKGLSSLDDWQEAAGLDPKALDQLREAGVLEEEVNEKKSLRKALVPVKAPDQELSPKARAGLEALYSLGEAASMAELARYAEVGTAVIKRLVEKGYIGLEERALEAPRPTGQAIEPIFLPEPPPRINGGRLQERLRLLAGLVQNKAALVLFPEVSLLNSYLKSFPGAEPFHGEMPPELRRQQFSKHHQLVFATYQGLMLPFAPERIVIVEDAADAYKLAAGSRARVTPEATIAVSHRIGAPAMAKRRRTPVGAIRRIIGAAGLPCGQNDVPRLERTPCAELARTDRTRPVYPPCSGDTRVTARARTRRWRRTRDPVRVDDTYAAPMPTVRARHDRPALHVAA